MIKCYDDFVNELKQAGFSMGGGNPDGIYSVITWGWEQKPPYETPVRWHTGDPETDPWQWRMRVLEERNDIAYAKVFFRKSGYITADWYPYFFALRRGNRSFHDVYYNGQISNEARKIYTILSENGPTPLHILKSAAGMNKKEMKSRFDRALVDLQMGLFITMCARQQKVSKQGVAYGWFSTVFSLTEHFFDEAVFEKAASLSEETAEEALRAQIRKINPDAKEKQIGKFIRG
ncbi:MAG: hypothetical protein JW811_08945 [Clostridiales bacterium]|nr:hypothetical protein [Clostridiales bacterium]